MRRSRWADIAFFLGFAGVMYAILCGTWKPDRPEFVRTIAALILGALLVTGSFAYLFKIRGRGDNIDD